MKPIVLITGATAGIGKAAAIEFARNGHPLILTGRRQDRLDELEKELKSDDQLRVLTLCFDVRNRQEVEENLADLPVEWQNVGILVNNAGLASGFGPIDENLPEDWERMIDTNLKGLLYVTKVILPGMKARRSGHVINISSIAGKEAYKDGVVYCATKHGVEAITKGMRIDLLPYGIKVTSISPGAVETEFSIVRFSGDRDRAKSVYNGYTPLKAQDIAEAIYFAASRPAHVNINDLLIMPTAQANSVHFNRES